MCDVIIKANLQLNIVSDRREKCNIFLVEGGHTLFRPVAAVTWTWKELPDFDKTNHTQIG